MSAAPVIVVGGGGHGRVVLDALLAAGVEVLGVLDPTPPARLPPGVAHLGPDAALAAYAPGSVALALGVGSTRDPSARVAAAARLEALGHRFVTVVHPRATVAPDVTLHEGAQVMAGAVIQSGARVARHAIVNTGALVDHDCEVGEHSHVAPGAVLCGDVRVEDRVHVGARAVVLQGRTLGAACVVGAGAVVTRDVAPAMVVTGVPARAAR